MQKSAKTGDNSGSSSRRKRSYMDWTVKWAVVKQWGFQATMSSVPDCPRKHHATARPPVSSAGECCAVGWLLVHLDPIYLITGSSLRLMRENIDCLACMFRSSGEYDSSTCHRATSRLHHARHQHMSRWHHRLCCRAVQAPEGAWGSAASGADPRVRQPLWQDATGQSAQPSLQSVALRSGAHSHEPRERFKLQVAAWRRHPATQAWSQLPRVWSTICHAFCFARLWHRQPRQEH